MQSASGVIFDAYIVNHCFSSFISSVDISVGLSREDPLYSQKLKYLEKSGRGATSVRFPLQRNRYPSELVDFLRLLLVEPEDLGMQVCEFRCHINYSSL